MLRTTARGLGQSLLTVGFVLLLFVVYELWVTDLQSDAAQEELATELREEWTGPAPSVPAEITSGEAFAFLHVPRLGADYARAVVEGTGGAELAQGPGHYTGTAMPGEQGNFAVAGHRVGRGSPFLELDELRPGDPVVVETADRWFVYRVLGDPATGSFHDDDDDDDGGGLVPGREIVSPSDVSVISPTPGGAPGGPPTGAYLTLTTCHPEYSARQRLVVHAVLDGAPLARADAPQGPPPLREG
ncbi:class E sortase [Geodermatophilus sp. TF02-6]|nr:class E sortase [Geodermatophilus sp. TF02-6]